MKLGIVLFALVVGSKIALADACPDYSGTYSGTLSQGKTVTPLKLTVVQNKCDTVTVFINGNSSVDDVTPINSVEKSRKPEFEISKTAFFVQGKLYLLNYGSYPTNPDGAFQSLEVYSKDSQGKLRTEQQLNWTKKEGNHSDPLIFQEN